MLTFIFVHLLSLMPFQININDVFFCEHQGENFDQNVCRHVFSTITGILMISTAGERNIEASLRISKKRITTNQMSRSNTLMNLVAD